MQIVEATRSYTNYKEEGRVRVGMLFAVDRGATIKGKALTVITGSRAKTLLGNGLVRVYDATGGAAAIHRTSPPNYPGQESKPTASKLPLPTQRRSAAQAREAAPKAPTPLANPASQAGGKTGATALSSSSAVGRPPSNVPLGKRRGNRKALKPSPSTTPSNSPPGPASSTPATGAGGVSIKDVRPSRA